MAPPLSAMKYARLMGALREYHIWCSMISRCESRGSSSWPKYGGRGITIAPVWRHSFQQFLDDMGPCPPGLTIDRIDNDGPYAPGNCRWADRITQANNRRDNRRITHEGVTLSVAQWARRIGMSPQVLDRRLNDGWSTARALDPTPEVGGPQVGYRWPLQHRMARRNPPRTRKKRR